TLGRVNDQGVESDRVTTRTDDRGAFSFTQLPERPSRLSASTPGYTSRQLPSGSEPTLIFDVGPVVDLGQDGQALDLQVVLHRTASIAGRIIRPDGSAA